MRWIAIAVVVMGAVACGDGGRLPCDAPGARRTQAVEEAAVYAAVLDSFYVHRWHLAGEPAAMPGEAVVWVRPSDYGPENWGAGPPLGVSGPPEPDGLWMRLVGITPAQRFRMPVEYWRLPGSLFAGYRAANVRPTPLAPVRLPGLRITVLDSAAMARTFPSTHAPYDSARFAPDEEWARFRVEHSSANGLVMLSRVGFDRGCDWAVVAVLLDTGSPELPVRAVGGYVFLRRGPAGWRIWRTAGTFD